MLYISCYCIVFRCADQTPTPTRFLRNCEEVGLFSDLELDQASDEEEQKTKQVGWICTTSEQQMTWCRPLRTFECWHDFIHISKLVLVTAKSEWFKAIQKCQTSCKALGGSVQRLKPIPADYRCEAGWHPREVEGKHMMLHHLIDIPPHLIVQMKIEKNVLYLSVLSISVQNRSAWICNWVAWAVD